VRTAVRGHRPPRFTQRPRLSAEFDDGPQRLRMPRARRRDPEDAPFVTDSAEPVEWRMQLPAFMTNGVLSAANTLTFSTEPPAPRGGNGGEAVDDPQPVEELPEGVSVHARWNPRTRRVCYTVTDGEVSGTGYLRRDAVQTYRRERRVRNLCRAVEDTGQAIQDTGTAASRFNVQLQALNELLADRQEGVRLEPLDP
jgi:hypothetical protein